MEIMQSWRRFVTNAAIAGAAGFGVLSKAGSSCGGGKSFAAEPKARKV